MIFRGASKQFSIPYFWAFLACAVFRFLAVIPFVIDDDEAWWAVSARWLKHPGDFYRSVPDVKTPGSVWFGWGVSRIFGALGFDPNVCADPRVIRFVFIGFTLICALLLGKIGQRFHRKSFWFSALFFLTASVLPSPKLLAFTGDGLMALFVICGYALALLGESSVSLLFAGVFLAFGLLVKQTAIFAAFPLLFSRSPKKWSVPELSWIFLGSLSVLLPSIWALGFQEMIFWVWTYPKEILIAVRGSAFASPAEFISNSVVFFLALLPLSIAAFRFRPTFNSPLGDSPLFDFRVQWLLAGLLVILAGKGLFLHYYLMAVPPLALLLADVYSKKAMRPWETLWLGIGYAACCILVTIPALQVSWGTDLPYFSRLQKAIAPALKAEDSVLVWGGSPLPLAYSGARPVTRFFLPRYAVAPYGTEKTHQIFEDELAKDPPSIVIDLHERGDNRFGNSLESEPMIAALVRDYQLYVAPGVPWAKFYFRSPPPENAHLVRVPTAEMKERVYTSYPSVNPAWKPFETLVREKPSFSTFGELMQLESSLRAEHALELIALYSTDPKARHQALSVVQKLKSAASPQERTLASMEANRLLAVSSTRSELLPLNTPEWWFTVSLSQMQPRISPQPQLRSFR